MKSQQAMFKLETIEKNIKLILKNMIFFYQKNLNFMDFNNYKSFGLLNQLQMFFSLLILRDSIFYLQEFIFYPVRSTAMKAQELDVFPLKNYQFMLNRKNSLSSITTLILTTSTIALAVFINYQTVSHLWLKRNQLPITQSRSSSLPNPLTSTLLCYTSNNANSNGTIPKTQFFSFNQGELFFPSIQESQLRKTRPLLANQIQSSFRCVDIANSKFTQINNNIEINLYAQNVSLFIEVANQDTFLQNEQSKFKRIESNTSIISELSFRVIDAIIKDSLQLNYQPVIYTKIYNDQQQNFQQFTQNSTYCYISLKLCFPNLRFSVQQKWNKATLIVKRFNIGVIVGVLISWISVISVVLSLFVSPIMNKYAEIQQIKSLFYLQPSLLQPSLIKFMIASFKKGIFSKEDKYVKLYQRLQTLKNINFILKIKNKVSKLCPRASKTSQKQEIVEDENIFGMQLKQQSENYFSAPAVQADTALYSMSETQQKEISKVAKIKKDLFCWLDLGSESVTIKYKGNGHQSKKSVCISIILFIGFLVFLIMLKTFQISKNINIFHKKHYDTFSFQINPRQILLVTEGTEQILAELIDGNLNTISNLTLSNSSSCLNGLSQQQLKQIYLIGNYIYCFQDIITLVRSPQKNKTVSLYINNINFQYFNYIYIVHFPTHSSSFYYNPLYHVLPIDPYNPWIPSYYQTLVKVTNLIDINKNVSVNYQTGIASMNRHYKRQLTGINMVLDRVETTIEQTSNTFFDLLQNIWGFSIIFFTVILKKITKYINYRQKDLKITHQKAQHRQNICVFLSKINGIVRGRHKQEIKKMRCFIKSQMQRKY